MLTEKLTIKFLGTHFSLLLCDHRTPLAVGELRMKMTYLEDPAISNLLRACLRLVGHQFQPLIRMAGKTPEFDQVAQISKDYRLSSAQKA